ncbi:hypothetical protein COV49_00585 [Candidatus Falkowbacteria bacterium CG11_big_fil_rev_8_21_14_0_20_39_10]|uniref:Uncharacterized protein n=1 Tax=Candidatus Falkowbacteria bacterium CG11_big_fil_rev_8_21_14_0_20_39_10 TaxID=1974570 RepID=A0A2M6K9Y0_9BACT|nr:MAG: hypothetical protein COV49_00585 [Candidatus Falkowbacteria bacterium CG11_big_fil_rev_8_21_14_0_20_39_10]
MYYRLAPIILNSSRKSGLASEVFISQPDADKEELAGKLFIILEIEAKTAQAIKIIDFLINNINHNYYHNEKIILRERISTLKVEHIFETSLAKTNKNLAEFLDREKIKININKFNITVGLIYKNELHFSGLGKNKGFLIYLEKDRGGKKLKLEKNEHEKAKYKIMDIDSSSPTKAKFIPDQKNKKEINFFSDVISGHIPSQGYFLFTNEALPEYLSQRQLIEIITKLPPAGAAEQIKNTLSKINAYISFSGLIIKNTIGEEEKFLLEKMIRPAPDAARLSIEELSSTEAETEKLLTPSGIVGGKKWLNGLTNLIKKIPRIAPGTVKEPLKTKIFLKDKIFLKRKEAWIQKIASFFKGTIFLLAGLFIYLFKILTSREALFDFLNKIKSFHRKIIEKVNNALAWIKNLNFKNKILFTVAALCLILFLSNLTFKNIENKKQVAEQNLNGLIASIEQKQNQVEANLLYNNEIGAKEILNEIKELLAQLPAEDEKNQEAYQELLAKNESQMEKIRHVVKINNALKLADFVNLNSSAQAQNIALLDNKIYAGDDGQKTIYIINLSDNLATAITDLNSPIQALKFPAADKNGNIYYLNNSSIIQLNTGNQELTSLNLILPEGPKNIVGLSSYNNRLYAIDNQNSQIYRLDRVGAGFTANPWLTQKTDLIQALDLSIDGHIYVLTSSGQILKYLKGQSQEFELDPIEPEFASPTKIHISQDLEFIYILEPAGKRLAIFNKTGKFIIQYQSDNFSDLKDFTVDEAGKKIYLLNGNSVYEVEGKHFGE